MPIAQNVIRYDIVLPAGSFASNFSGGTVSEISTAISGLRPFAFPFIAEPQNTGAVVDSPHVLLFVRHGANFTAAQLAALDRSITIAPALPGRKLDQTSSTVIQITGAFSPRSNYSVTVASDPSITDFLELGLDASAGRFTADATQPLFAMPQPFRILGSTADGLELTAIARGSSVLKVFKPFYPGESPPSCDGTVVRACAVALQDVVAALNFTVGSPATQFSTLAVDGVFTAWA